MLELAIFTFTTLFATVGPIDNAIIFAGLSANYSLAHKRKQALKGVLIGSAILLFFAICGDTLLSYMGISFAALRLAGGLLLILIGINLVMAKPSGGSSTISEENTEAAHKADISVFPLATPLIAGPGSISAVMLAILNAQGDYKAMSIVILALLVIMTISLVCFLLAGELQRILGITGMRVIERVMGVLLTALAFEMLIQGIKQSGIFPSA